MAKALPLDQIELFDKTNLPTINHDFGTAAILLLNKPKTWTSFDVVKYVRNRLKTRKVGHAGTLDPMAEGLLILCSGRATKSISELQDLPKTYIGEITFGGSTPSYDGDSDIDVEAEYKHITEKMIAQTLKDNFIGEIQQIPPMYSAIQVKGQRLYHLARRGEKIELKPRSVTIHSHKILSFDGQKLSIEIKCSKGTYIRSIAHDIGIALNSRAYLSKLIRTKIGKFSVDDALSPAEINELLKRE